MSAFMSVFFLGGYHSPDIINLILDSFYFLSFYFISRLSYIFKSNNILENSDLNVVNNNLKYQESINTNQNSYIENTDRHLNSLVNNTDNYIMTKFNGSNTIIDSINLLLDKINGSYILGIKIIIVVFFFIWVRASFPRLRYDQLMSLCWKELLPLVFAYIIFTICIFFTFDMMPFGTNF